MTYIGVHWKGRPHHHLPRIRVTSRTSIRSRKIPQRDQSAQPSLNEDPSNEKKKYRFNLRFNRRKSRAARSISSTARARRRASVRAKQGIQIFGWDSPAAELASLATEQHPSVVNLKIGSRLADPQSYNTTISTALVSTDGAGASIVRRAEKLRSRKRKSKSCDIVNFDDNPLYRTANQQERDTRDTVPLSPLEKARKKTANRGSHTFRKVRTYDLRIAPSRPVESVFPGGLTKPPEISRDISPTAVTKAPNGSRQSRIVDNPAFWDAARSVVLEPNEQRATSRATRSATEPATIKSAVKSILSDTSSRTPSQRKAINKFTKELELYLQATRSLPKQSLFTSPPASTVSANTIEELKPFHKEFQSVGLAVTSEEQRGMASGKPSKSPKASRAATVVKGKRKSVVKKSSPSFASGSTGTTVMGFTPPFEKTYDQPRTPTARYPSSSDHTVVGFTPPHETSIQSPPPKRSTRKTLPWLRKVEAQSNEPSLTKKSRKSTVDADDVIKDMVLPVSSHSETSSFETKTFPSRKSIEKKPETAYTGPAASRHPNNARQEQPEYSTKSSPIKRSADSRKKREHNYEGVKRTSETKARRTKDQYSDVGTQTEELKTQRKSIAVEENAPGGAMLTSGLSKTFPMTSRTCHGECQIFHPGMPITEQKSQPSPIMVEEATSPPILTSSRSKTFPLSNPKCHGECQMLHTDTPATEFTLRPARTSRVQWIGIDQATQSEEVEGFPPLEQEDERDSPIPALGASSRLQSIQSRASTENSPTPAQMTQSRTLNNSIDEGDWVSLAPKSSEQIETLDPQRLGLKPPRCTQCFCEFDHIKKPQQVEAVLEPEYEIRFESRKAPRHVCRARSSMQCQQCFPSRPASTVSPLQAASAIAPEKQSARPSLKVDPIRQESLHQAHVNLVSSPPPEHQYSDPQNTQFYEQPVADPVKKPTVPKLKLRTVATTPPAKVRECAPIIHRSPALPKVPNPPTLFATVIPFDLSSTLTSIEAHAHQLSDVSDKAVFKGLHVATAAACDEDVDRWIEDITGFGVRQYLAELSKFEGLGYNTLAGVAKRAAKQRKNEAKGWEILRDLRAREQIQSSSSVERSDDVIFEEDKSRGLGATVRVKRNNNSTSPQGGHVIQGYNT